MPRFSHQVDRGYTGEGAARGRMSRVFRWGVFSASLVVSTVLVLTFAYDWRRMRLEPSVTWTDVALMIDVCATMLMWTVVGVVARGVAFGRTHHLDYVFFIRVTGWAAAFLFGAVSITRATAPPTTRVLGGLIALMLVPPVWSLVTALARRVGAPAGWAWLAPTLLGLVLLLLVSIMLHL